MSCKSNVLKNTWTWNHPNSLGLSFGHTGLSWTHRDSPVLAWTDLDSLGLTCIHVDSFGLGLTWTHLPNEYQLTLAHTAPNCLTFSHIVSQGNREHFGQGKRENPCPDVRGEFRPGNQPGNQTARARTNGTTQNGFLVGLAKPNSDLHVYAGGLFVLVFILVYV